MRNWVAGSAFLTVGGIALVISQGYFTISDGGSSDINSLLEGAGLGFSGMIMLVLTLGGRLERFPRGVPGSGVERLRRKAIGYSVTGVCLACFLLTSGGLAIAGTISRALSVVVMWICFFVTLALIVRLGRIKQEALRVARKE